MIYFEDDGKVYGPVTREDWEALQSIARRPIRLVAVVPAPSHP